MNLPTPNFLIIGLTLFPLACSDPPAPPNQGAMVETISPTPGGNGCQASSAPFAAPPNADPVSGTAQTLNCDLTVPGCKPNANIVVDGDNASVKCTVSGGPDSFTVSGVISQGDTGFSVQGSLGPTGGKAFVSSGHGQYNLQDPNCDIIIEANKGQIVAGAIWASFNCTAFGDRTTGQTGCTATGKFIFENCGK